jgi:hypothetical protein
VLKLFLPEWAGDPQTRGTVPGRSHTAPD